MARNKGWNVFWEDGVFFLEELKTGLKFTFVEMLKFVLYYSKFLLGGGFSFQRIDPSFTRVCSKDLRRMGGRSEAL